MTDDALQYYKELQSDIRTVKEKIRFIKNCLEEMNKVDWQYDINKARVRQIMLDDLMKYRDRLKDLERRWTDTSILEVTE